MSELIPNVLATFNSFDVRHNGGFKIITNSSVDALGMVCSIRSFKNITVFSNMVVYWVKPFNKWASSISHIS